LGLLERVEDLAVQKFVPELPVEAFAVAVLPRTGLLDERSLGTDGGDPVPNGLGDELRALV